jgi:hypothetical protein
MAQLNRNREQAHSYTLIHIERTEVSQQNMAPPPQKMAHWRPLVPPTSFVIISRAALNRSMDEPDGRYQPLDRDPRDLSIQSAGHAHHWCRGAGAPAQ